MKLSPIVRENKILVKDISDMITDYIYNFIFKDAFEIIQDAELPEMQNSIKKNILAILKGIKEANIIVEKTGDMFIKKSSSTIAKAIKSIGGIYRPRKKTWKIDLKKYPDIDQAQTVKNEQYMKNVSRIKDLLIDKQDEINNQIKNNVQIKLSQEKIKQAIKDIVRKANIAVPEKKSKGLGISLKANEALIEQFKDEYLESVSLPIVNMEQRAVERLRERILPLVIEEGITSRGLAEILQKEFDMTKRHAEFVARQETRIIKSKIIRDRALRTGHSRYIWRTAHDDRVRDMHARLDGEVCDFNNPPIINNQGDRGNPGEDYNCRCIARIILSE